MNSYQFKKQNEKNERIIRNLMKLEENKKCFDCTSKIITYVNLSVNTFICTECSGLLRELNHRVKNISLSTFTQEEINGLRNGGNKIAKSIWLANWNDNESDPNHNNTPISTLKKYIKDKYVNKKWYKTPNSLIIKDSESKINELNYNELKHLSTSFNETEYYKMRRSQTKQTEMDNYKETKLKKRHSYHSNNPFNPFLIDEKENILIDTTSTNTPSSDIFSNSTMRNNQNFFSDNNDDYTKSNKNNDNFLIDINMNTYNIKNTNISNGNINNNNTFSRDYYFNTNKNNNNSYYDDTNKYNNNNVFNNNHSYNNNSYNFTSNYNINTNNTNNNNNNNNDNNDTEKKHIFGSHPIYAPRSSSLLNKVLIDSVCNTKNNYKIDNKKVYFYKKKSHNHYPVTN